MKFDKQLRPATETSWVVSYGGKTIQRWRTAATWKSLYRQVSKKIIQFRWHFVNSSKFWTGCDHVIKNENVALDRLRVRQNVFLVQFLVFPFSFTYRLGAANFVGTKVSLSGFIWNNQNISWVLLLLLKYAKCRQQYRTVQLTAVTFILSTDAVDCAITYIRTWYATSVIASKLIRTANCSHTLHNHETQIKQVNLMLACLCA